MFLLLAGFIAIIWGVEVANTLVDHRFSEFGIVPRTTEGLRGILLWPFLHAGFGHVISNTLPMAVLGGVIAIQGGRTLLKVSVIVALVSGVGVWAVARNGIHVGASGLVFGYFGYLVARGWYQRSFSSIVVAILVVFFYGGLIFGIVPSFGFVSWEGHLFGLLAGILAAKIIDEKKPSDGEQAAED
ncbi:MAG: rhomboid family intramembrane serine protease [SAR202 cluster bacterium]|jgi:membrane associated rhomboid family serine protease|nr:rhomboid family intramembrane serine protease [SAR202 cluster bacterium]MDP6513110.1 rhomboid family intramembrane serine protease [SAR202 cluster bacterium]MDP6715670.1 rhomboid family intramembrane serine protease [SAR202 cluster bacterium]